MDESGLWRLFFLTGLPEVYLAIRGGEQERANLDGQPALTAFAPRPPRKQES